MVIWVRLENMKCPSCPNEGTYTWMCAEDGNPTYVNELGVIECQGSAHTGPVINWRWNCGSSKHNGQFLPGDYESFGYAISQAVQLSGKAESQWLSSLILAIGKQYGR
ncbi:uncharacterized protein LOC132739032 [Ruditapes philippinarum]|uniref:uncharacterized protein LOC132739032 n=1 Tax=Ruditapes philippinarum TaxID=129788 RepID=UPI00295BAAEF|nr:uncharacterized protein LOC132739032 [Ruditapes philippinarum]